MKLIRKNFFDFYIAEKTAYHIESQSHPLWKAENQELLETLSNGWHTEDFALPLFLRTPIKETPKKISYPPIAYAEISENLFQLKPVETFFEPKSEILLKDNLGKIWSIPTSSRSQQNIALPPTKITKILFLQGQDIWFLAQAPFACEEKALKIPSYQNEPLLSVKSFLDPENGLEKLMADIEANKWPLPRKVDMIRLLKILQAATPKEEITILANIRKDDREFFEILEKKLLSPKLLPYMNRNQVSKILQNLDEGILKEALSDEEQKILFRPFFSKNRFSDLVSSKPSTKKTHLWDFIVEHFRRQFCFVYFEKFWNYDFYPASTTGKTEKLQSGEYVTSNENFFVEKVIPPKLYIYIHKYFQNLWIYPQIKQGIYRYLHFQELGPGLLVLDDIPLRPQYIFFAAISGGEVFEAIAVDILRFVDKSLKKR